MKKSFEVMNVEIMLTNALEALYPNVFVSAYKKEDNTLCFDVVHESFSERSMNKDLININSVWKCLGVSSQYDAYFIPANDELYASRKIANDSDYEDLTGAV